MNMYNLLFGRNPQSTLLLAVIGLRENDVERFRDVGSDNNGQSIWVYTRTGGGNREDYPNETMRALDLWVDSVDDDFDNTYCTDTFRVPTEFTQDVVNLSNVLKYGIRPEFGQHILKTLEREPTQSDIEHGLYQGEKLALEKTHHVMANGHTFVPYNDSAMRIALEHAEKNNGELRSCWGILPLTLKVRQDYRPYPNANTNSGYLERVKIDYEWVIDNAYWEHCRDEFSTKFPLSMSKIADKVADYQLKVAK